MLARAGPGVIVPRAPPPHAQPDRQEAGRALVDADVQPQTALIVGVLEGEGERRVARAWAQHDVADAAPNQLLDDDAGLRRRGVHVTSVSYGCAEPPRRR